MSKWTIPALTLALTVAAALALTLVRVNDGEGGDGAPGTAAQSPPERGGLPGEPAHVLLDDSNARDFETLGELVATATAVVRASVVAVQPASEIRLGDSSGRTLIPRLLTIDVDEVLYGRSSQGLPDQLLVNDGYWEDGQGYVRKGLDWAEPGDTGYFFLSRDRGPDGQLGETYSLLDTAGRVLVDGDRAEHAADAVWDPSVRTADDVAAAVRTAVSEVRAGTVEPVLVDVCWPSTPGDENSARGVLDRSGLRLTRRGLSRRHSGQQGPLRRPQRRDREDQRRHSPRHQSAQPVGHERDSDRIWRRGRLRRLLRDWRRLGHNTFATTWCGGYTQFYVHCDLYAVQFNLSYMASWTQSEANATGCHEFGHTAGLGHRTHTTDTDDNSCMQQGRYISGSFDAHDLDAINNQF